MKQQVPTYEHVPALKVGYRTECGAGRQANEDAYSFAWFETTDSSRLPGFLALVADGIGGRAAGEQASQDAVQTVKDFFLTRATSNPLCDLVSAIQEAHNSVRKHSLENPDLLGMGTTLAAVVVLDHWLHVASVGDSRVYLIRGLAIHQLTVDHTWAQEASDVGRLTLEQARAHPNRNVLIRFLGIRESVEVDLRVRPITIHERPQMNNDQRTIAATNLQPLFLHPSDTIVLCTDGLSDNLEDIEIQRIVSGRGVQEAVDQLVNTARRRGARDDTTAIIIQVPNQATDALRRRRSAFLDRLKWRRWV